LVRQLFSVVVASLTDTPKRLASPACPRIDHRRGPLAQGILMKKLIIATLASSLLVTGVVAGAQTARARITDTPIRTEANLASAIIAMLKEGGPVDVVDIQGEWYRVLVPNEQGKPRVGYVLANLIEILNANGSSQAISIPPASKAERPVTQGQPIPPTAAQLAREKKIATERAQARVELEAAKAEMNAARAELDALRTDPLKDSQPGVVTPEATAGQTATEACRIFITEEEPSSSSYVMIRREVQVGKKFYGGHDDALMTELATQANKVGADAVIKFHEWRAPSKLSWAAAKAGGMAVKWTAEGKAAVSGLKGQCWTPKK
jgi:hypothetical protein